MRKQRMVQCATKVNKDSVRRESINGVEHVIVSSFTLPDDVVMNGGLYPASEIAKSFNSLERTLAPVEHPTDSQGNYISASDPEAIHNFHAGAFNVNVTQEGGRIHIEKHINVQEALKTERGKRLMDRIEEVETNATPRPIHTSVGVFLEVEEMAKPKTNAEGHTYTWIARNMFFDHDAILLDSVGAAQPSQGVGMAVNSKGDEVEVDVIVVKSEAKSGPARPSTVDMRTNAEGRSFQSITDDLQIAITGIFTADWMYIYRVFNTLAVFETPLGFFEVPWSMTDNNVTLTGLPISVDRNESFTPKVNAKTNAEGEDKMKDLILAALAKGGIETDGLSEDVLIVKYNDLIAVVPEPIVNDNSAAITLAVSEAIKPLTDKIVSLEGIVTANTDKERSEMETLIVSSGKYEGLDAEGVKALPIETLKAFAACCGTAHGVPLTLNQGGKLDGFQAPTDMPE